MHVLLVDSVTESCGFQAWIPDRVSLVGGLRSKGLGHTCWSPGAAWRRLGRDPGGTGSCPQPRPPGLWYGWRCDQSDQSSPAQRMPFHSLIKSSFDWFEIRLMNSKLKSTSSRPSTPGGRKKGGINLFESILKICLIRNLAMRCHCEQIAGYLSHVPLFCKEYNSRQKSHAKYRNMVFRLWMRDN